MINKSLYSFVFILSSLFATMAPAYHLNLNETGPSTAPMVLIEKDDATVAGGDASLEFKLTAPAQSFTVGIDNDDGDVFKLSDVSGHSAADAGIYAGINTLLRVHTSSASPLGQAGILDINHQSRARWGLSHPQLIPPGVWTPVEFDVPTYDEHAESTGAPGTPWTFTASQEGYYQINSRVGFQYDDFGGAGPAGWVSIAVFVNGLPYAQGNNLDIVPTTPGPAGIIVPPPTPADEEQQDGIFGPAPNVSDVIYLMPGDVVQIFAGHTLPFPLTLEHMPFHPGYKGYVSIHKSS